jgi:hypothetical protein
MTKKSAVISVLVLVVIILGAWLVFTHLPASAPKSQPESKPASAVSSGSATPTESQKPQPVPQTTINNSQLPPGFPSDIPLEAGATITQNYTATNFSGMFQSSRDFISAKSMAENFALYQAALKKSGWTITSATNDTGSNRYIIFATKTSNFLNILISTNSSGQVIVSINNETKP